MSKPYVYRLIDPRDGATFYVGKGTNRRAWQHERDVRRGKVCNEDKTARIREIIAAGQTVGVSIVAEYKTDELACDAERALIAKIGLANLTNQSPGGQMGAPATKGGVRLGTIRTLLGWAIRSVLIVDPEMKTNLSLIAIKSVASAIKALGPERFHYELSMILIRTFGAAQAETLAHWINLYREPKLLEYKPIT